MALRACQVRLLCRRPLVDPAAATRRVTTRRAGYGTRGRTSRASVWRARSVRAEHRRNTGAPLASLPVTHVARALLRPHHRHRGRRRPAGFAGTPAGLPGGDRQPPGDRADQSRGPGTGRRSTRRLDRTGRRRRAGLGASGGAGPPVGGSRLHHRGGRGCRQPRASGRGAAPCRERRGGSWLAGNRRRAAGASGAGTASGGERRTGRPAAPSGRSPGSSVRGCSGRSSRSGRPTSRCCSTRRARGARPPREHVCPTARCAT